METLAKRIEERMHGDWSMIRDEELERLWPINEEDREEKIAQFAKKYGFRLRVYLKGICAIFDKGSAEEHNQDVDSGVPKNC
jgi:hypothetical protein